MDVFTDPISANYKKWLQFTLPDTAGGRTAIAVSTTAAARFTALYTILIIGIFMVTWNILISVVLLLFTPEKMTRTSYVAVVAAWNANDPLQATFLMLQHIPHIVGGMISRKYKAEFNWVNLRLDIAVLVVAAGNVAGSFAMGILFPNLLIIGSSAPVNPELMYYPDLFLPVNGSKVPEFLKLDYASRGALRAFGAIEGSEVTINPKINLNQQEDQPWKGNGRQVERYIINYDYNVAGAEMGLQKFGKLAVYVQGSCSFADTWWYQEFQDPVGRKYDNYRLWNDSRSATEGIPVTDMQIEIDPASPPLGIFTLSGLTSNINKSYYSILPVVAGKLSSTESLDPWYETNAIPSGNTTTATRGLTYNVASKRPPLSCYQIDEWSYNGWKGSTTDLLDGSKGPIRFPDAIKRVLQSEFKVPMIVNIGRALQAGALKCSTQILPDMVPGIDAQSLKAMDDMKRAILAAYLSTRNVFRDVALAGAQKGIGSGSNILQLPNGKMRDGVGDVVIESSAVSSLRLGCLIAIPLILVILIIISGLLQFGRNYLGSYNGTFNGNRYSRFCQFLAGLHAAQLYRMVDQILAQVDIQDDPVNDDQRTEGTQSSSSDPTQQQKEYAQQQNQAHWSGQISALPRVVVRNNIPQHGKAKSAYEKRCEIVLPQLRVVKVAGDEHRLTLRIHDGTPLDKAECEWRKLNHQAVDPRRTNFKAGSSQLQSNTGVSVPPEENPNSAANREAQAGNEIDSRVEAQSLSAVTTPTEEAPTYNLATYTDQATAEPTG